MIKCSLYQLSYQSAKPKLPCVIYCHCFNGSRIESLKFAEMIIKQHCYFVNFDFAGSGNSQGDYVTLGYYEQEDIEAIIRYLKTCMEIECFALWGRSMGAVTALLYAQRDPTIKVIVVDSPFTNMNQLALEISQKKTKIPSILIKGILALIKNTIQNKANFSIDDVDVLKNISKCRMPVLFITSQNDTLISNKHTEKIYQSYQGEKKVLYAQGDHNEARHISLIQEVIKFIVLHLPPSSASAQQFSQPQLQAKIQLVQQQPIHPNKYQLQRNAAAGSQQAQPQAKPHVPIQQHSQQLPQPKANPMTIQTFQSIEQISPPTPGVGALSGNLQQLANERKKLTSKQQQITAKQQVVNGGPEKGATACNVARTDAPGGSQQTFSTIKIQQPYQSIYQQHNNFLAGNSSLTPNNLEFKKRNLDQQPSFQLSRKIHNPIFDQFPAAQDNARKNANNSANLSAQDPAFTYGITAAESGRPAPGDYGQTRPQKSEPGLAESNATSIHGPGEHEAQPE